MIAIFVSKCTKFFGCCSFGTSTVCFMVYCCLLFPLCGTCKYSMLNAPQDSPQATCSAHHPNMTHPTLQCSRGSPSFHSSTSCLHFITSPLPEGVSVSSLSPVIFSFELQRGEYHCTSPSIFHDPTYISRGSCTRTIFVSVHLYLHFYHIYHPKQFSTLHLFDILWLKSIFFKESTGNQLTVTHSGAPLSF